MSQKMIKKVDIFLMFVFITTDQNMVEGSLMQQTKALNHSFHMLHQRTFTDFLFRKKSRMSQMENTEKLDK